MARSPPREFQSTLKKKKKKNQEQKKKKTRWRKRNSNTKSAEALSCQHVLGDENNVQVYHGLNIRNRAGVVNSEDCEGAALRVLLKLEDPLISEDRGHDDESSSREVNFWSSARLGPLGDSVHLVLDVRWWSVAKFFEQLFWNTRGRNVPAANVNAVVDHHTPAERPQCGHLGVAFGWKRVTCL